MTGNGMAVGYDRGTTVLQYTFTVNIPIPELLDLLVDNQPKPPLKQSTGALDPKAVGTHKAAPHGAAPPYPAVGGPCAAARDAAGDQQVSPQPKQVPPGRASAAPPAPAAAWVPLAAAPGAGPCVDAGAPPAQLLEEAQPVTWESPISDLQDLHAEYVLKTKFKVFPPHVGTKQMVIITWPQPKLSQSMITGTVAQSWHTALIQVGQAEGEARKLAERRTP